MYTSAFTSKLSVTMFTTTDGKKCDTSRPVDIIAMSCFKPSNFVRTFESRNFSFNRFVSSAICFCDMNTNGRRRRRTLFYDHHHRRERERERKRSRRNRLHPRARLGGVSSSRKGRRLSSNASNWRRGMNWIPFSRYNLGIFFSLENNNNKKKKKPIAERVQKSPHYLRVVHELGVAVAGGDCHVVKVVKVSKSPNSRFLLWGRKLAQKENKIAKKDQWQNPKP